MCFSCSVVLRRFFLPLWGPVVVEGVVLFRVLLRGAGGLLSFFLCSGSFVLGFINLCRLCCVAGYYCSFLRSFHLYGSVFCVLFLRLLFDCHVSCSPLIVLVELG